MEEGGHRDPSFGASADRLWAFFAFVVAVFTLLSIHPLTGTNVPASFPRARACVMTPCADRRDKPQKNNSAKG